MKNHTQQEKLRIEMEQREIHPTTKQKILMKMDEYKENKLQMKINFWLNYIETKNNKIKDKKSNPNINQQLVGKIYQKKSRQH